MSSTRAILFRAEARAELLRARDWYESRQPALGAAFAAEIDHVVEQPRLSPERYPVVHRDIRRALVRRFPYGIFYQVSASGIVVLSISHLKRNPRRWQSRA